MSAVSLLFLYLVFSPGTLSKSGSRSILSLRGRVRVTDTQLSRDYSALVHAAFPTELPPQSNDIWAIHDSLGQSIPMTGQRGSNAWSQHQTLIFTRLVPQIIVGTTVVLLFVRTPHMYLWGPAPWAFMWQYDTKPSWFAFNGHKL